MSNVAVIGLQWGDEGKGKITDVLASDADLVVRFQGGANAGHTLVVGDKVIKSHLIPSGILYPKKISVIGTGCVFDPEIFEEELKVLNRTTRKTGKILISENCHVVFPFHKVMDGVKEKKRGPSAIGTTKRGIGPCYADKYNRIGIRVSDLVHAGNIKQLIKNNLREKNFLLRHRFKHPIVSYKKMYDWADKYRQFLKPFIGDTESVINDYASKNKNILFEGAQGSMLGIDYGTYPYVTSSNTVAGNVYIGGGLSPEYPLKVLGVVKAYATRVGNGPFPGELNNKLGNRIREKGNEFGATTGRPRRTGWLNLKLLESVVKINGVTGLALTKLDVLSGLKKIGVHDKIKKSALKKHISTSFLQTRDFHLKYFPGWDIEIDNIKTFQDLPVNAREYIKFISKSLGVPVSIISLGAQRKKYIKQKEIW